MLSKECTECVYAKQCLGETINALVKQCLGETMHWSLNFANDLVYSKPVFVTTHAENFTSFIE